MSDPNTDAAYVADLENAIEKIWEIARRMGLDPYPVHFELVPATIMYEFGSYGLPGRFSHWSHGKAYYRMKTEYDYGLSKIYELVVNTNPSYAFLMEQNDILQNKVVVAHVLGHTDFFKNNVLLQAYAAEHDRQGQRQRRPHPQVRVRAWDRRGRAVPGRGAGD